MDLGFGKYRKFYIVGMILRSLVTSFMPNYGTLKAWQTNETYQPLGNVPTGGYVSKRNLLCNRPQYNQIKFNNVNKLISPLNGVPNWEETFLQKHTVNT